KGNEEWRMKNRERDAPSPPLIPGGGNEEWRMENGPVRSTIPLMLKIKNREWALREQSVQTVGRRARSDAPYLRYPPPVRATIASARRRHVGQMAPGIHS